jgi:hypothetical protein
LIERLIWAAQDAQATSRLAQRPRRRGRRPAGAHRVPRLPPLSQLQPTARRTPLLADAVCCR